MTKSANRKQNRENNIRNGIANAVVGDMNQSSNVTKGVKCDKHMPLFDKTDMMFHVMEGMIL